MNRWFVLLYGDDPETPAKVVRRDGSEASVAGYARRAAMADDVSKVEIARVVATYRVTSERSSGLTMLGKTETTTGVASTSGGQ